MKQIQMYEWLIKYDKRFKYCCIGWDDIREKVDDICEFCVYRGYSNCESYGYDCGHGVDEYLEQSVEDFKCTNCPSYKYNECMVNEEIGCIKDKSDKVKVRYLSPNSLYCLSCSGEYIHNDFTYCPHCGKEIDWEGNE